MAAPLAPYVCLDGMNEKGLSIAVLTLDSEPVHQNTGKPVISTTLAIRLVLDRAASTQEAVDLLREYDMFASSGKDYHFYIADANGDACAVEWDCDSEDRTLVATPVNAVTNFYALYADLVHPGERNVYAHGKDRFEAIRDVFQMQAGSFSEETGWDALKAAAQNPNTQEHTSNTQWSILYDNTKLTAEIVLRRHWDDCFLYTLSENEVTLPQ